jgi:putative peptide zinc metalloprotease protein
VRALLALNLLAVPACILHFRSLMGSFASYYAQRTVGRWLLTLALLLLQGALHELGHGLALTRYGQPPREAGIVLMFLLPGVYIDTSAADLLPDKRQRIAVSFAGILVNDLSVLLGLLAHLVLPAGLVRDAIGAFVIGNTLLSVMAYAPFLKTDTYFILSDYLDVPNLRQTSVRVLVDLLAGKRVERAWKHLLAAYATLSFPYYAVAAVMSVGSLYLLLRWLAGLFYGAIRLLWV